MSRRGVRDSLLRPLNSILMSLVWFGITTSLLLGWLLLLLRLVFVRTWDPALALPLLCSSFLFVELVDLAIALCLVFVEVLDELVDGRNAIVARVMALGRYWGGGIGHGGDAVIGMITNGGEEAAVASLVKGVILNADRLQRSLDRNECLW
jgi:hypothetical protein